MVNINLSTNEKVQVNQKEVAAKNGLTIVIIIFISLICLLGGLLVWKNSLNKQTANLNKDYQAKYAELTAGRNIEVTDLQNRIFLAKDLVKQGSITLNALKNVEKSMVSGAYLDSYESDEKAGTLKLECVADNYEVVARHILSLKSAEHFSEVAIANAVLTETGKVKFSVSLKFN